MKMISREDRLNSRQYHAFMCNEIACLFLTIVYFSICMTRMRRLYSWLVFMKLSEKTRASD